jgi:RDD family
MSRVPRRRSSGRKHSQCAVPSVRPWVRYWARIFDILLFSLAAAFLIRLFASRSLPEKSSVQALEIFILFVWAFVEAALLSAFGTTPGKWLFKVKLTPQDGSSIRYRAFLTRSLKVWWRGLGAGFPLVSIVTLAVAYSRLIRNSTTSWDREGGFVVRHEQIGPLRIFTAVMFFAAVFAFTFWSTVWLDE